MRFRFGSISTGKIIVFLVLVIVCIQIWHINMLSKQEERTMEPRTSKKMHVKPEVKLKRMLLEKVESAHILDSSGSYHVVLDVFGARDSKLNDVTLVSQTSSYHLNDVVDLCEHWSGPVSISLFTYSVDFEYALRSLIQLYLCYPKIKEHVSFHLIFPISHKETVSSFIYNIDCKKINRTSDVINYDIDGIEYPHNLLRNTAIKFSKTKYVFLIDIDMVPNMNLREDFNKYVFDRKHNTNESIVFVVPSFESKVESGIPTDREHLLRLWRLEKLRPFYFDVCWKCQRPLQYDKWKFLPKPENLEIAYLVDWQDPWEPFYIAPRNMPMYDERFKQYGFNRISQVCETNIAGYYFGVLNNAFIVHKGYKYRNGFHKTKEMENNRNRDLYRQFKMELKTKYPDSQRSC